MPTDHSIYSSRTRDNNAHKLFQKLFIQNGFGHVCKICDQLWFKNELKNLNDENMKFVRTFLSNFGECSIAVCPTCRNRISIQSMPSMAVHNGFKYPANPDNLLNCPSDLVSERLISPRILVMQIRRLRHVQGQYEIYEQVINVPVEVDTMVNKLPRNISDEHCIYVHIKRKNTQNKLRAGSSD
ncbi:OTU domain-containing protein [Trichonephila clavipes]|uniref:OTU domain-containing protein n=1 Tax=Trichonephila clavipes TaxID=2585209 RepID=A0A8X6VVG1_TRICX|nr:OTU domain-containing protein [Trichonephila clavipes]